jgi:hypothetical protein
LLRCMSPRLAQSEHHDGAQRHAPMSAYDAVDGARSAASKCYRLVASKAERFKEVRLRNDGVLKFWRNWRGHDDVMQTRSIWGSGEPAWVSASLNACLRLGPDPRRALWPAATPAAQTGRTHDRTRPMLQQRQKVLAKAAPSTHDPKRTLVLISGSRRIAIAKD